jgi:hypothetical protein
MTEIEGDSAFECELRFEMISVEMELDVAKLTVSHLSPCGRGLGEGVRSVDGASPLTRIASVDAIRPLPQGESGTELVARDSEKLLSD